MITDNPDPSLRLSTSSSIGGHYQSTVLLRTIALMLLTRRGNTVRKQCKALPSTRSVDDEVGEVMKRREIVRLNEDRQGLCALLGVRDDPRGGSVYDVPPLMMTPPCSVILHTGRIEKVSRLFTAKVSRLFTAKVSRLFTANSLQSSRLLWYRSKSQKVS